MTTERRRRIEVLFDRLIDLEEHEQETLLEELCGADADLRDELASLLIAGKQARTFLERPAARVRSEPPPSREIIDRVGAYEVVKRIGHGGMSDVYLATRADDEYRQRVAVKVLRFGAEDEEIVNRFRNERQILAGLDHPNISRLLDGGSTEGGRPYLVMELVEGVPLTRYCDDNRLSIRDRLKLFQKVCEAVSFAHQNLVVHRDIKPSNILVTAAGVPKLLDFGIAKLLNPELSGNRLYSTSVMTRLMTPLYASPEQVSGGLITTASDIYSLGVVLFELLTGELPLTFEHAEPGLIERVVCTEEPSRPSTVVTRLERSRDKLDEGVSTVFQSRQSTARELQQRLSGDLDHIVLHALRKEPLLRYRSVEQFSEDLCRYRDGRPVMARRGTWNYRTGKLIRRHWKGFLVTTAVAILLISSSAGFAILSARLARERDRAEIEREHAEAVTDFMVSLFKVSNPSEARGSVITARELLDKAADRIDDELVAEPLAQARMMDAIGETYYGLGLYKAGGELLERCLSIRRSTAGVHADLAKTANTANSLAVFYREMGAFEDAEKLHKEALTMSERAFGSDGFEVAAVLSNLAGTVLAQSRSEEALAYYERSLAIKEKHLGPDDPGLAGLLNNLAVLNWKLGNVAAAIPPQERYTEIMATSLGPDHPDVAILLTNLGVFYSDLARYEEAMEVFRRSLAIQEKVNGPGHPDVAATLSSIAKVLIKLERYAEARPLAHRAVAIYEVEPAQNLGRLAASLSFLAAVCEGQGELEEAVTVYQSVVEIFSEVLGPNDRQVATALNNLAVAYREQGKIDDAVPLVLRSLEIYSKAVRPGHPDVAFSLSTLATLRQAQARFQEAGELFEEALVIQEQELGLDHPDVWKTTDKYVAVLHEMGRESEAAAVEARSAQSRKGERKQAPN